jgi:hypothetical protein
MTIDEVYRLVNFVANKEQSGNTFKPSQFNLIAKMSQLEFISKRLGNIKMTEGRQAPVPPFGYKSNRKVDVDLRPLLYGPITVPIDSAGKFYYPDRFMWPDSVRKTDLRPMTELDEDEYPHVKHSTFEPPTEDYPIYIYRNPYGFVDPYNIGNFSMSYVKTPPDPIWGYDVVSGVEVYNSATSQDFTVNPYTNAHLEICLIILAKCGINLSMPELTQYAMQKENSIS